jgi:selenocysteine lyase/cysteine desulfurase
MGDDPLTGTVGDGWRAAFAPFDGRVWLNCAHQGPLPRLAAEAAREAVAWKEQPWELSSERFTDVPARLRAVIGRLINAPADDVILGNGASHGLHLLAQGLPLAADDEVLTMEGDFPSDILPWLGRTRDGIIVRQLRPQGAVLSADEVAAAITPRTRALCLTWVHSLSGWAIDLDAIGQTCRDRRVVFIVNASQALGVRPLDVTTAPVDAVVSVGWKWLCGPYATGFCWIRPALRAALACHQVYWLSMLTADDLARSPLDLTLKPDAGARRFDIFGTANFFNFSALSASIAFLLEAGIAAVGAHDAALVDRLLAGLDRRRYRLLTPQAGPQRSTLVFIAPHDRNRTAGLCQALLQGRIHVAHRAGALRLAPHLYNTAADIDAALAALDAAA